VGVLAHPQSRSRLGSVLELLERAGWAGGGILGQLCGAHQGHTSAVTSGDEGGSGLAIRRAGLSTPF